MKLDELAKGGFRECTEDGVDMTGTDTEVRLRNLENAIKGQVMVNKAVRVDIERLTKKMKTKEENINDELHRHLKTIDNLLKQRDELLEAMRCAWDPNFNDYDARQVVRAITQEYGYCVRCRCYHDGCECDD